MLKFYSQTQNCVLRVRFPFLKPTFFTSQLRCSGNVAKKQDNEIEKEAWEYTPKNKLPKGKRISYKWTEEDRQKLLTAVKTFGNRWSHIASTLFPGRTPNSCYQMHLTLTNNFKKGPWSADEDETLRSLTSMEQYRGKWKVISEVLGRSSACCYSRWQSRFKPDVKTGRWTEEEDLSLLDGVEKYGRDWERIVKDIPGRSSRHALLRYDKFLNPNTSRDKWSPEEDDLLLKGCQKYGRSWTKISESIPSRTPFQLQARYDAHVNPKITKGRWTDEESEQLLNLVKKYGHDWTRVAQELSTKSNVQALLRYNYLRSKERKAETEKA
ncbi:Myblike DNAbinding domain-containing protein [Basidiobolus ranarum]|uniref:Myblike DNAbinding domain-containing protein n=1 Tax=Basidiobolus ranarum TaxID=34480 RepID=A0ABR2W4A3_9FUNG